MTRSTVQQVRQVYSLQVYQNLGVRICEHTRIGTILPVVISTVHVKILLQLKCPKNQRFIIQDNAQTLVYKQVEFSLVCGSKHTKNI